MTKHSDKRQKHTNQVAYQQQSISYSGPIPPPSILEGYEKILPGAAEKILKLSENQR